MRTALVLALAAVVAAGCSLTIDPDSVKPPPGTTCVPTGCTGKACGSRDCATVCQPGSGCVDTHSAPGAQVGGASRSSVAGGHSITGAVTAGASPSAPGGHAVRGDSVSQ